MEPRLISRTRLISVLILAAGAAVLLAAALPAAILAGDAEPYRERMAELFSGRLPYLDFPFEHLPGALVPLALAWLLGGFLDLQRYVFALSAVSTALLMVTGLLLRRIESHVDRGLTLRWLILLIPLLPFLLFRNDNWPVLLMVAAFVMAIAGRSGSASWLAGLGIVSKIWPVTWAAIEWWRGRRREAGAMVVLAAGALFLLRTEPVLRIQQPTGVQTETLAGSLFGLIRVLAGSPLQVVRTSAAYIDVPSVAHLINVVPGLVLGILAIRFVRMPFSWRNAWLLAGSLTGAIVISSPILSTQYLAWLAPFAAGTRRAWALALLVNSTSLVLIITWDQLFEGTPWWWVVLVVRNILLVWQVFLLTQSLEPVADQASRS